MKSQNWEMDISDFQDTHTPRKIPFDCNGYETENIIKF